MVLCGPQEMFHFCNADQVTQEEKQKNWCKPLASGK